MNFKGKKVFISGGNGVIGNELVKRLHNEGATIFVGDLKPRPLDWPRDIIYRQGDLNYITKQELDGFSPEIFFHLAATFERSTETYGFWDENFSHNVNLSHHLMTILKDGNNLKKVIFASSYLIYNKGLYNFEDPAQSPYSLKEDDPINPRNLTGCAKLSHEIELNFIKEFKGKELQVINARIYRSYGRNSRDIVSRWVRALIKKESLTVFNKENIFDYIFAGDVAEGLLRLAKTNYSGVVNLGTGKSRNIKEVVSILKKHFPMMKHKEVGQKILYEASQADTALLKKLTGWTPSNRLEDVIPKIIKYEKEVGYSESVCNFNVLITSVAKKIGMINAVGAAMKKIGNEGKLFGGDMDANCLGKYFVDSFWKMPKTDDSHIDEILTFCKENKIKLIIPSRDGELEFWSENKHKFQKNKIKVMVSDYESVGYCVDKLAFYKKCKKHNLPAIETSLRPEKINATRYVVKEQFGAGSRSIAINVDEKEAIEHGKTLSNPIFQPFIKGKEYSVDFYISDSGDMKGAVIRERNLVVDGESQITTTIKNEKIGNVCEKLAKDLNLHGHNLLQILVDGEGKIFIIECNTRFGGASTLSIFAGLDSFYWLMLEAEGVDISDYRFERSGTELRQIRYSENMVIEI